MQILFDPSTLAASELRSCKAGTFFHFSPDSHLQGMSGIRLAGGVDEVPVLMIEGREPFHVVAWQPHDRVDVLEIGQAPYLLQIKPKPIDRSYQEPPGSLVLTQKGAYIVAARRDRMGFNSHSYVSFKDWTVVDNFQGDESPRMHFPAWALTCEKAGLDGKPVTLVDLDGDAS